MLIGREKDNVPTFLILSYSYAINTINIGVTYFIIAELAPDCSPTSLPRCTFFP